HFGVRRFNAAFFPFAGVGALQARFGVRRFNAAFFSFREEERLPKESGVETPHSKRRLRLDSPLPCSKNYSREKFGPSRHLLHNRWAPGIKHAADRTGTARTTLPRARAGLVAFCTPVGR